MNVEMSKVNWSPKVNQTRTRAKEMSEATMCEHNITNLNFEGMYITPELIKGMNLEGANFKNATFSSEIRFWDCNLAGANFEGASFEDHEFLGRAFIPKEFKDSVKFGNNSYHYIDAFGNKKVVKLQYPENIFVNPVDIW